MAPPNPANPANPADPGAADAQLHSAFYRFVPVPDPVALAQALRQLGAGLCGSIVVAGEGINGTVAGAPAAVAGFEAALQQPTLLGGALRGVVFKHSGCVSPPFGRLKVSVKPEIVALGLPAAAGGASLPPPDAQDASHLAPAAWRALLARDDLVLLDNRNHFEFRLGHFRGAMDPQVNNFRDFVAYVQTQAPAWRAAGRPVAMYCTGGIRCDKTAPWLRSLGLDVWQLDGGILNYLQQCPPAADVAADHLPGHPPDWQGECFVFDNRIALDSRLQETTTTAEQVFDPQLPDEAWRLQRARQLDQAAAPAKPPAAPP
jgi:UPF0176 protein